MPAKKTSPWMPTHLDKVYWPEAGYTKSDLLDYYEKIAPFLLPYLKDRPVVMKRFPEGIDHESFFQKNCYQQTSAKLRKARDDSC
jgi:DNA primase